MGREALISPSSPTNGPALAAKQYECGAASLL